MAAHTEILARGLLRIGSHFLLCRNTSKGYLYLPGGHVEFGEGVREALAREFMEEAGLKVRVRGLLDVSEGSFKHEKRFHHEINLVFHVELAGRLPKRGLPTVTTREKKIDFVWCTKSEIREADVRPATGRMLLLRTTASTFRLPDIFQSDI